jgi:hypothetical protein
MIMARMEQILPLSGHDHGFRPVLAMIMPPGLRAGPETAVPGPGGPARAGIRAAPAATPAVA